MYSLCSDVTLGGNLFSNLFPSATCWGYTNDCMWNHPFKPVNLRGNFVCYMSPKFHLSFDYILNTVKTYKAICYLKGLQISLIKTCSINSCWNIPTLIKLVTSTDKQGLEDAMIKSFSVAEMVQFLFLDMQVEWERVQQNRGVNAMLFKISTWRQVNT